LRSTVATEASTLKHWQPDAQTRALARKHGRESELGDLRILHNFVHGSTIATEQRYAQGEDESVEVGGPAVERDTWARASGFSASYSALLAARAFCSIANLAEPPDVEALLGELLSEATSDDVSDHGDDRG
jgi:hypothetical protein